MMKGGEMKRGQERQTVGVHVLLTGLTLSGVQNPKLVVLDEGRALEFDEFIFYLLISYPLEMRNVVHRCDILLQEFDDVLSVL